MREDRQSRLLIGLLCMVALAGIGWVADAFAPSPLWLIAAAATLGIGWYALSLRTTRSCPSCAQPPYSLARSARGLYCGICGNVVTKTSFDAKDAAIVICIIFVAALYVGTLEVAILAYRYSRQDVVGSANGQSLTCHLETLRNVSNGRGGVAILRDASCPFFLEQGAFYYVLFVHAIGAPNSASNMALQYDPGHIGDELAPPPSIKWRTDSSIIVTAAGTPTVITRRHRIGDVAIEYRLRQPGASRERIVPWH